MVLSALTGLRGRPPVNVGVSLSPEKHAPFSPPPPPASMSLSLRSHRPAICRRAPRSGRFPGPCAARHVRPPRTRRPGCRRVGRTLALPSPLRQSRVPGVAGHVSPVCPSVDGQPTPFLPLAPINRAAGNKNSRTSFCADMFSVLLVSSFRKTPGFLHIDVIKNASCVFP